MYPYQDMPGQVAAIEAALQSAQACLTTTALTGALTNLHAQTRALTESRAPVWLNALKVQVRTDVYNKSAAAIKTEAAARNDGWDARNLLFVVGFNALVMEGSSTDYLRHKRVSTIGRQAKESMVDARLVASSQMTLAKGNVIGATCVPSLTTNGLPAGGKSNVTLARVRAAATTHTGAEIVGTAFQWVPGSLMDSEGAAAYVDVYSMTLTYDSLDAGFYGVVCFDLNVCSIVLATGAGAGVLNAHAPPAVPKYWSVASVTWNAPDGTTVTQNYPVTNSVNKLNQRFSFNVTGGTALNAVIRFYAISATGTGQNVTQQISYSVHPKLYVLDPTKLLAQTSNSVRFISNMRFDDAVGNGYMNCGDCSVSLGGCVQAVNEGAYNNALIASTIDSVNGNGVGVDSIVNKYTAVNAAVNSVNKMANPAFWTFLNWVDPEAVRRITANFMSDMATGYALLETTETFSNQFQVKYFGAQYMY